MLFADKFLGFERATAISTKSAAAIVEAAIDFGQSDDITVVTVERLETSGARVLSENFPRSEPV